MVTKVYEATVTVTIEFAFEHPQNDDPADYAREMALEMIGGASDKWLIDGMEIDLRRSTSE